MGGGDCGGCSALQTGTLRAVEATPRQLTTKYHGVVGSDLHQDMEPIILANLDFQSICAI
jgi:Fe-S cluster biogenesis protein NfuA